MHYVWFKTMYALETPAGEETVASGRSHHKSQACVTVPSR